ncbi:tRNA lysidine(34) synthetase TilS [Patescibacteria group bacterium]
MKYLNKNTKVVLALSGGPDSVYLLHKLRNQRCEIIAAHFNHKLRGRDSDLDQEFCKKLCKKLKIDFETEEFEVKKYAKSKKMNLEEASRDKRYEFLRKIKEKHNAKYIVTAHHADDNLETFLMNFLRGAGLNGLKSMQTLNNDLLRPILTISKQEILKYLKRYKFKYRIDKTNIDPKLTRNKLRLEVIPTLKEIQPTLIDVFNRNVENLNEINEFIENEAKNNSKNLILRRTYIVKLYKEAHSSTKGLTQATVNRCLNLKTGKKVPFGPKLYLTITKGELLIIPRNKPKSIRKKKLAIPGKTSNLTIQLKINSPKDLKKGIFLDYSKLKLPLYVRGKKHGDRFSPYGLKGTKKIQDFFTDKKVPNHLRNQIPLIVDKNDKIVAIPEFTIDNTYKIQPKTSKYLEISVKKSKL